MDSNINFTNFITKGLESKETDNRRIVKGHLTAEVVDRQDEYVAVDEVLNIIKNYMELAPMLGDWHSNRMVGKVYSYKKSEIEGHPSVYIEAEIFKKDGVVLYDEVWKKVLKGDYQGFSIGGGSKKREPIIKDGKLVMNLKDLEIYEISLCPLPANPLAIIDYVNEFAKAANLGVLENGGKSRIQCSGILCEVSKGADHVSETSGGVYGNEHVESKSYKTSFSGQGMNKAIDSDVDVDVDHTGSEKKLKPIQKPIRGHSWDYWEDYLTSEEGGNHSKETAGKIIGKWEKEEKEKVKKDAIETLKSFAEDQKSPLVKSLEKIVQKNAETINFINTERFI